MCGLIAQFSKNGKPIAKSIIEKYESQKFRGDEGFGYVALYADGFKLGRHTEEEGIKEKILKEKSLFIAFHHRNPTSTPNLLEATHPMLIQHEELEHDYFVGHNGVIRNAKELKEGHIKDFGYDYQTVLQLDTVEGIITKKGKKYWEVTKTDYKFNDSEAFAIELCRCIDGMKKTIDAVGTIAFWAVQIDKKTKKPLALFYGHNGGNPLTIEENDEIFSIRTIGGKSLPENILYKVTLSGDNVGEMIEKEMSIGYESEYQKNNRGQSYHHTNPTPFPKLDVIRRVNAEIPPYVPNGNYGSFDEYYQAKYAKKDEQRQLVWEEDDGNTIKKVMGYDTSPNRDDTNIDIDTTKLDDFDWIMEKVFENVEHYSQLEDEWTSLCNESDLAESFAGDANTDKDRESMWDVVKKNDERIDEIKAEMSYIEDKYQEDFSGTTISFGQLVDAYHEDVAEDSMDESLTEGLKSELESVESGRDYLVRQKI